MHQISHSSKHQEGFNTLKPSDLTHPEVHRGAPDRSMSDVNYFFHGDNYKCRSERYLSEAILLGNRGLIVSVRYFPGFLGSVA